MSSERRRLGDFEIVREIGRGGMGVVYEAIQLSLNRKVALKVLPPGTTPEQRDIERFRREAQGAAQLDHPHIVPIYAQGEEEGTYYYAMKLVQGRSLDRVIQDVRGIDLEACTRTDLERTIAAGSQAAIALEDVPTVALEEAPPEEARPDTRRATELSQKYFRTAARLIMEVAEALEYAHSQGVIHRDIKPHNLILTPEGHLAITDFGLARFLSAPSVTVSGEMMGTPAYMSPEQVRAEQQGIDHRTDIYSLGVTLYEMLALEVPFRADTREALLRQILMKDPPPLRRIIPRIPRDLETICHKAIEKDPSRRYQSAKLFAHDLGCFLEGLPIVARPLGWVGRLYRRALRRKALVVAVAGTLVSIVAVPLLGVVTYWLGTQLYEMRHWYLLSQARNACKESRYRDAERLVTQASRARVDLAVRLILWDLMRRYEATHPAVKGETLWSEVHAEPVTSLAWSPDGSVVASGAGDGTIRLRGRRDVQTLSEIKAHSGAVSWLEFNPGAQSLVSWSLDENTTRIWDRASGQQVCGLAGSVGWILARRFPISGPVALVMGLDANSLFVARQMPELRNKPLIQVDANLAAANLTYKYGGISVVIPRTLVESSYVPMAFAPDSRVVAFMFGTTVVLTDIVDGKDVQTIENGNVVVSAAFSPRGSFLACGLADGVVELRRVTLPAGAGRPSELRGHSGRVTGVAFDAKERILATASTDGNVILWDVQAGREMLVLGPHQRAMGAVAWSPDGRELACGVGNDILIYDFHAYDEDIERWLRKVGVTVPGSAEGQAHPSSP